MAQQVPVPDKDDPIWTAARGFVVRKDEGPLKFVNGGNERVKVKVTSEQTDGRLALLGIDVTPGFGNNAHAHGNEDEAFYIASGDFRFINGSTTFDAGAGDFVYIPRGTRHGFKNIGSEMGTLMVFYTPAGAEQFFLDYGDDPDPAGAAPPEWTPERLAAMGEALEAHRIIMLQKNDDWT
ncbi:quercetin dioxygenase-like cupin family protein [Actinoplanes lutulentus]|uniref:Cupin domain-containing protein n=1 Tax=Actinoplanes lutulentus TaxID=1287878 RepID=A0A327Z4W1_9ACTN|nr:cupin domain-containing protein [Actinoplanes lutulentus]MBB2946453.1 quercetin dioxygenase-like cupin family protein [Actinoplanes lutulentus]RAK25429.1 Cupin domain-containing protein [Actinoplanes lutulentus]